MKLFDLQGKGTNFIAEILAGITAFLTMTYLLVDCPAIMADSGSVEQAVAYIAVCLTCFFGCVIMTFIANQPMIVGPSIGMTVFFTSSLMGELGYSYPQALVITLLGGLIFLILSITGLAGKIHAAIPGSLTHGVSGGIGIYIALLGFKNAGLLAVDEAGAWTLVNFSVKDIRLFTTLVMLAGLLLIGIFKKFGFHFAPLLGILSSGILYYIGGTQLDFFSWDSVKPHLGAINENFVPWASAALFKNLSVGVFKLFFDMKYDLKTALALVVTILVCALFNTMEASSVIFMTARNSGRLDDGGNFGDFKKCLLANSISSVSGSFLGSPMISVAPQSGIATAVDGKTGLATLTAGFLFLLALLFAPVASIVPSVVTACAMIYLGIILIGAVKDIDFGNIGESVPALIALIVIPFTSSIIDGLAVAFIAHTLINLVMFQFKSIKLFEFIITPLLALGYILI